MPNFSGRITDSEGNAIEGVEGTYSVATDGRSWQGSFSVPIKDALWIQQGSAACWITVGDGAEYPIGIERSSRSGICAEIVFKGRGAPIPPA
jgi:hypothetical protein